MASFADNIPQFNPYVSQLPVELMTQVGMQKQEKYEQGVEKLQSYYDNVVGGLDMAKDSDKQYAQSLINQVGSNMKWVAAGDFSNQQLVNSVGNMATQITKDPKILNAVSSTALYRQQRAKIQKDIDEGKSNPANIDEFDEQAAPWLNSKEVGEKFNGTYNPFFDVDKFAKEQFDAIKPGGYTHDQVFETDINGHTKFDKKGVPIYSPVMIRLKKEGRLPQEVAGAIDQIMSDPRVSKQLGITGKYNYKGLDSQNLIDTVYNQRDAKLSNYLGRMAELNLDKKLGKDVQADIDSLQSNIDTITSNYDTLAKSANENPNGLRGYLYKEQVKDNYRAIYGSTRVSEETMANPGWDANFKLLSEANEQSRFTQRLSWDMTNAREGRAATAAENKLNRESALNIALTKGKGKGVPGTGAFENIGGATWDENSSALDPIVNFERKKAEVADGFLNSSYNFIWDAFYNGNARADKNVNDLIAKGNSREGAIKLVMDNMAKQEKMTPEQFMNTFGEKAVNRINKNLATASPKLIDQYKAFKNSQQEYNHILAKDAQYTKTLEQELPGTDVDKQLQNLNTKPVSVDFNGQKYNLTKEDFFDAAVYMAGHKSALGLDTKVQSDAAQQAERRLAARGKSFILDTAIDQFGNTITGQHGIATGLIRAGRALRKGITGMFGDDTYARDERGSMLSPMNMGSTGSAFQKNLQTAFDLVHNETTAKALTRKGELIKADNFFRPNVKADILTGDAEEDRATYQQVQLIAGNYVTSGKNLAPKGEPAKFLSAVSGKNPDPFEVKVSEGPGGQPMVTLVSYDDSGVSGSLVIAPDEASNLRIDVGAMYETPAITNVRSIIYSNPSKRTSHGDPADLNTYRNGDSYYQKWKLPKMANSPSGLDAQVNIEYSNSTGLYYANVYGSENGKEGILQTDGFPDLKAVVSQINNIDPTFVRSIIKK